MTTKRVNTEELEAVSVVHTKWGCGGIVIYVVGLWCLLIRRISGRYWALPTEISPL